MIPKDWNSICKKQWNKYFITFVYCFLLSFANAVFTLRPSVCLHVNLTRVSDTFDHDIITGILVTLCWPYFYYGTIQDLWSQFAGGKGKTICSLDYFEIVYCTQLRMHYHDPDIV